ncbi:hypothetical protein [Sedimentitalea nanhaiensis]|uniref:Uncharacterized protein n=1 Tax=Sedimentitalea nanhaiensis TaxID=999627 RepID=A0A1I6Y7R1_9RHOB|nr:hypothetical protein [Sedimentitalea nanhaiensis]SFT46301.1 hypothetical protein SAMN05216236_10288 [Sedimentitalea nanhaiensis]
MRVPHFPRFAILVILCAAALAATQVVASRATLDAESPVLSGR